MKRFPTGDYGRQKLEFFPAPAKAPLRAFAVLLFAWEGDQVLVCDIVGRGWCIPSGRVEPRETSVQAAHREALEEGGVTLDMLQYIGCYRITERSEVRWADAYTARIAVWKEIGVPEESKERKLAWLDELPDTYHVWNELTGLVFQHASNVLKRSLRHGSSE